MTEKALILGGMILFSRTDPSFPMTGQAFLLCGDRNMLIIHGDLGRFGSGDEIQDYDHYRDKENKKQIISHVHTPIFNYLTLFFAS